MWNCESCATHHGRFSAFCCLHVFSNSNEVRSALCSLAAETLLNRIFVSHFKCNKMQICVYCVATSAIIDSIDSVSRLTWHFCHVRLRFLFDTDTSATQFSILNGVQSPAPFDKAEWPIFLSPSVVRSRKCPGLEKGAQKDEWRHLWSRLLLLTSINVHGATSISVNKLSLWVNVNTHLIRHWIKLSR